MCGLRIFAGIYTIYGVTLYLSATVALVYINMQNENKLSDSTRYGQFQKFGQEIELGALSSPATPGEKFCTVSEFLFMATCASDLTFLAPLTSEI